MKVGLVKYKTKTGKNVERYAKAGRCSTCGSKKMQYINKQTGEGLLSSLFGFKSPFKNIPIIGSII